MSLQKQFQLFKSGVISWVDLAKELHADLEKGVAIAPEISGESVFKKLVKAYQFLETENLLDDSRMKVIPLYVVQYMPFIKKLMVEDPERYKNLVTDVLLGKVNSNMIENISKELRGKVIEPSKSNGSLPGIMTNLIQDQVLAMTKCFEKLQPYFPDMRKNMGKSCDYLSQLLQSVADDDYYTRWKEREQIQI